MVCGPFGGVKKSIVVSDSICYDLGFMKREKSKKNLREEAAFSVT